LVKKNKIKKLSFKSKTIKSNIKSILAFCIGNSSFFYTLVSYIFIRKSSSMVERWSPKPNAIGSSPIFSDKLTKNGNRTHDFWLMKPLLYQLSYFDNIKLIMSKIYLRAYKKLKVLNDGSCVYKYDNGCKSSFSLYSKDISTSIHWNKYKVSEASKKDLSTLDKYKKKFTTK
jgi:hypothetical protein